MATNANRPVFDFNAASASAAMVTGKQYRYTGTANLTATSFTGTTEGAEIVVVLEACDGSHTFTFPSSKRFGDANSATTVITPTAGNHVFKFWLVNATWYYSDTITAVRYAADAGASDSYAITVPNYTAYTAGDEFSFKANTVNTGAATLNVNSIGAVTIKKFTSASPGADLADNDIRAGQIVNVVYDGTNFQMMSALGNAGGGQAVELMMAISDETTALTTGTAKLTMRAPWAFTVTGVRASVNTVSSSGNIAFDINEGGVSIFSTTLTIDANEKTSTTAATPAVVSDTSIADDAELTVDIDSAGTGAKGAKIIIYGTR